ncbi:MAG: hypothetical protein K9K65_15735 [Desulfarculaceae bacterium]|nr:hypothetical protein [Desulfarculaceae bacterium]MCF8065478.1 hypothetical protein [Desulfarculaceae bacterium]MCF8099289.1 hypothetical protein [Desulfarculaceae bacterium]
MPGPPRNTPPATDQRGPGPRSRSPWNREPPEDAPSRDAAASLGIDITRYKINAFLVSSFFAGVTGALYAH